MSSWTEDFRWLCDDCLPEDVEIITIPAPSDAKCGNCGKVGESNSAVGKEKMDENRWRRLLEKVALKIKNDNHIKIGPYTISKYPPIPDTDQINVIWMENEEGEGTSIDLDQLWKEKF